MSVAWKTSITSAVLASAITACLCWALWRSNSTASRQNLLLLGPNADETAVLGIGAIAAFLRAESELPPGWLPCNGQQVPTRDASLLHAKMVKRLLCSEEDEYIHLPDYTGMAIIDLLPKSMSAGREVARLALDLIPEEWGTRSTTESNPTRIIPITWAVRAH